MRDIENSLLVDIGNSTIYLANYTLGKIKEVSTFPTEEISKHQDRVLAPQYDMIVISSVVPACDNIFSDDPRVQFMSYNTIPMALNLKQPSDAGADRLVNALGAYKHCQKSCLVVDSGTATTFCYVDKHGVYQGGAIFPGLKMSSMALHQQTAKIPVIWVKEQRYLFGKSTEESVQVGLYQGFISLINGMIQQYKNVDPDVMIVGTGQGLMLLKDQLALDIYDPELIIKGLAVCAEQLIAPRQETPM